MYSIWINNLSLEIIFILSNLSLEYAQKLIEKKSKYAPMWQVRGMATFKLP